MDKDEILKIFKSEAGDEYRDHLIRESDDFGFSFMMVMAIVLMTINAINSRTISETGTLLFSFLTFYMYKRYKIDGERPTLVFLFINAGFFLAFFLRFLYVVFS